MVMLNNTEISDTQPSSGVAANTDDGKKKVVYQNFKNMRHAEKSVYLWTVNDVVKWVEKQGPPLKDYAHIFIEHEINGKILITLNDYLLNEIGVIDLSHRKQMLHLIQLVRLHTEHKELRDMQASSSKQSS